MQCVEYAKSRIKELTYVNSGITGNANTWYNQTYYVTQLAGPEDECVACWSGGANGYGHVGVVESWNGTTMDYSDANYDRKGTIIFRAGITETQMKNLFGSSYTFQGYVKLKR